MGGVVSAVGGGLADVVKSVVSSPKISKAAAPERQAIQATDEARRAAAALRARRIGSRALLGGSTLGPDEEKRTTLGVG